MTILLLKSSRIFISHLLKRRNKCSGFGIFSYSKTRFSKPSSARSLFFLPIPKSSILTQIRPWSIDLVIEHGWAYGTGGIFLKDEYIFNAFTSGGSTEIYSALGRNRYTSCSGPVCILFCQAKEGQSPISATFSATHV